MKDREQMASKPSGIEAFLGIHVGEAEMFNTKEKRKTKWKYKVNTPTQKGTIMETGLCRLCVLYGYLCSTENAP